MKKVLPLLLALALLLTLPAMAEMPFEGTTLPFEDYGVQITLPSDWNAVEIDESAAQAGMLFIASSPDQKRTFSLQHSMLEKETTVEEMQASLSEVYGETQVVEIDSLHFVAFDVKDKDISALAILSADGMGMYVLYFTPASDNDYAPIAQAIAASFGPIQE